MSGGTPVGARFMRQRHSQGYSSGDDFELDLEDDACSRARPQFESSQRRSRWVEIMENVLWIGSAIFIVYYGDWNSNLIYVLWHDNRIRRIPFYIGMIGVVLNIIFLLFSSMLTWSSSRSSEKWDLTSFLPFVTLVGIISFCLLLFALWPIWSFLTLPLLFTLFMAVMVLLPPLMHRISRSQQNVFRID